MTELAFNPTPEQVARFAYDSEMGDHPLGVIDSETVIGLMADAVTLDRRQRLARRLASARNHLMEATMNDYSPGSIRQATLNVNNLVVDALVRGWTEDDLVVWDGDRGHFRAVIS